MAKKTTLSTPNSAFSAADDDESPYKIIDFLKDQQNLLDSTQLTALTTLHHELFLKDGITGESLSADRIENATVELLLEYKKEKEKAVKDGTPINMGVHIKNYEKKISPLSTGRKVVLAACAVVGALVGGLAGLAIGLVVSAAVMGFDGGITGIWASFMGASLGLKLGVLVGTAFLGAFSGGLIYSGTKSLVASPSQKAARNFSKTLLPPPPAKTFSPAAA